MPQGTVSVRDRPCVDRLFVYRFVCRSVYRDAARSRIRWVTYGPVRRSSTATGRGRKKLGDNCWVATNGATHPVAHTLWKPGGPRLMPRPVVCVPYFAPPGFQRPPAAD